MKRYFTLLLALGLLVLCGCGATPVEQTEPLATVAAAAETPAPVDAPELTGILTEIRDRMRPGTAGSSLAALELGAKLLDWAVLTDADEAQIRADAEAFIAPMTDLERAEFALQAGACSAAVERLRTEDAAALMEDIGGTEGTLFPWEGAAAEKLAALFDAAGVSDGPVDPNA
ncbi:MAG: hypothetical protein IJK35_09490 [Oscillospiraceae bacterium]|nr:hypothetical protein [Oscillospiraceae bacterium]